MFFASGPVPVAEPRAQGHPPRLSARARDPAGRAIRVWGADSDAAGLLPSLYLETGSDLGLAGFTAHFFTTDEWPAGPLWFIWVLLAIDCTVSDADCSAQRHHWSDTGRTGRLLCFSPFPCSGPSNQGFRGCAPAVKACCRPAPGVSPWRSPVQRSASQCSPSFCTSPTGHLPSRMPCCPALLASI
jgi:hypothetical protein